MYDIIAKLLTERDALKAEPVAWLINDGAIVYVTDRLADAKEAVDVGWDCTPLYAAAPTAPAAQAEPTDERKTFEAWWDKQWRNRSAQDDAWDAWQARAAVTRAGEVTK